MTIQVRYAQEIPPGTNGAPGADGEDGLPGAEGEAGAAGEPGEDLLNLPPAYEDPATGVIDIDLTISRQYRLNLTGDITLNILAPPADGTKFSISVTQDSGGGHDVTWFAGIRWSRGGTPPTLTTTDGKRDTFGFEYFEADNEYDGFVIGQDI
jgi:hypothetical protein